MRWLRSHLVLILGHPGPGLHVHPDRRRRADELQRAAQRAVEDLQVRTASPATTGCTRAPTRACARRSAGASRSGCWRRFAATVLGTLAAFALVRHQFAGRSSTNLLIFLPMATPEIVMGSSLLALFVATGFAGQLGFWTILIAHIMFCLSFVVVTVRARLAGLSDTLEQAAMDLYATPNQTFWRVTFPLVFPGILGAALLALLAVVRRLHHHQPQRRQHHDVPDVRLGRRAQGDPDAGQRRRHGDVRDLGRDRGRRRGAQPRAGCARSRDPHAVQPDSIVAAAGARSSAGALDAV